MAPSAKQPNMSEDTQTCMRIPADVGVLHGRAPLTACSKKLSIILLAGYEVAMSSLEKTESLFQR